MVALACCLVLNLHIVAFADCTSVTPGGEPPPPPPPPSQSEIDAFIAFQESVFNTLFANPWVEEDLAYPLSTRVEGIGVYQGANGLGQPFTFDVQWDQPIDLATVCLTDEQRQQAIAEDVTVRAVAGYVTTDLAEVPVIATAISGFLDGQLVSYFLVQALADPTGPFLGTATTGGGQTQSVAGNGPGFGNEPVDGGDNEIQPTDCDDPNVDCSGTGTLPPPDPCANCEQCNVKFDTDKANAKAIRDAAKAQAAAALQADLADADAAYADAVSAAESSRGIAIAQATVTLAVAMVGCAVTGFLTILTGPFAATACVVIALALDAANLVRILATFSNAVANAAAARDAAKAAARQREQQACAAAEQLYDDMVDIAFAAFVNCRGLFNCDDVEIGCP